MDDSTSNPVRESGTTANSELRRIASVAWNAIRHGAPEIKVAVALPHKQSLYLTVRKYSPGNNPATPSRQSEPEPVIHLYLDFQHQPLPCSECRGRAGDPRAIVNGPSGLARYFEEIAQSIYEHGCLGLRQGQAPVKRRNRASLIKVNLPGPRARLLTQAERAADEAAAEAESTKHALKLVTPPARAGPPPAVKGKEPEGADEGVYSAPSIRFALASGSEVEVTIPAYVCRALVNESNKSNDHGREVGGILVGHTYESKSTWSAAMNYRVFVTDIISCNPADSSSSHITLSEESWIDVIREFDSKYERQNKSQLGWYHTRPRQGVFFSDRDIDSHTIFSLPFQFALVIDPQRMEAGLFAWGDYYRRQLIGPSRFSLERGRKSNSVLSPGGGEKLGGPGGRPNAPDKTRGRIKAFFFSLFKTALAFEKEIVVVTLSVLLLAVSYYLIRPTIGNWSEPLGYQNMRPDAKDPAGPDENTRRVKLSQESLDNRMIKFTLRLENSLLAVEYIITKNRADTIRVTNAEGEASFFAAVFGLKIGNKDKDPTAIRRFQNSIGMADNASGRWGDQTRHAFLKKALFFKYAKSPLQVVLKEPSPIQVIFD